MEMNPNRFMSTAGAIAALVFFLGVQIHQTTVSQVKGMLDPEQAKKFDAMLQKLKEHWGQKRDGGPEQ